MFNWKQALRNINDSFEQNTKPISQTLQWEAETSVSDSAFSTTTSYSSRCNRNAGRLFSQSGVVVQTAYYVVVAKHAECSCGRSEVSFIKSFLRTLDAAGMKGKFACNDMTLFGTDVNHLMASSFNCHPPIVKMGIMNDIVRCHHRLNTRCCIRTYPNATI